MRWVSMNPRPAAAAALVALVGVACGGGSGGSTSSGNSATGTVAGTAFAAKDAIYTTAGSTSGFDLGTGPVTVVSIESNPGACAAEQSRKATLSTLDVDMALAAVDSSGTTRAVSATGTYQVTVNAPTSAGLYAQVGFEPLCKMGGPMISVTSATGGSVTITSIDGSHIAGTLDLIFGNDHVTGSFDATNCSAFDVNVTFC